MLPKFHYKICNSSFNRYRGSSFIYRGNNRRKYCEALVQIGYNNRQLERRRLADHLWASTLPLAGKQVEGVAPLVQTELRFQSLWREGWKVDRSTTSNVFLPRREGEGKQRHRCRETAVIPGNCTVISQLRVIYCLNSTTARFRVYATDHSNRCHIYTDISEQLICSYLFICRGSDSMWHLNTCRHRERVGKQMAARCSRKDLMPELCVTEAFLRVAWLWHQACRDEHTN